jgi:outer membrane protein
LTIIGAIFALGDIMTGTPFKSFFRRIVLVAGLTTAPMAAWSETLADALVHAYNHSGLLDQQRALLRVADEDVAQALAALRPVLSYSASVSASRSALPGDKWDTATSVGLTAELLLFDGYASAYGRVVAKELVLATRQALVSAEQTILLDAVNAYMEVRRQSSVLGLRRSNVKVIGRELQAARDRFEVGEVTRTDVALADARLSSARSQLAAAEGQLAIAGEEFYRAVGRRPGNLQAPPKPPALAKSEDAAKAYAVRFHPRVKEAQRNVTASEFRIEQAKAGTRPTLTLRGQAAWDEDLNGSDRISLNLSGPIYSGGRLASLIRQQSARRDAQRAGLHLTSHSVRQGVGNAYAQLSTAIASKSAFTKQVRAARVAFRGVREEATLGARTTLDVLDAEQELLDANTSLISSNIDETIARYTILASMGLMTADHLKLGVRSYDPEAYYNLVKNAPASVSKQGQQLDRVLKALGKQ